MAEGSDGSGWGLVLSFSGIDFGDNTEHAFVHGFEAGQIWQRMVAGHEAEIDTTCHKANRTLIERAAAAQGWSADIEDVPGCGDHYIRVRLTKTAPAKHNPHGLRVVS